MNSRTTENTARTRRRGLAAFLLAATAVLVGIPLTGSPASAAACSAPLGNKFDGQSSPHNDQVYGSEATIYTATAKPSLCSNDHSFSVAWSMVSSYILGHAGSNELKWSTWAQIGFGQFKLGSGTAKYLGFAQVTEKCSPTCTGTSPDDPDVHTVFFAAPALGTTNNYRNIRRFSDSEMHMLTRGVQYEHTVYDPAGYWDASWDTEFFNEAGHVDDEVWGTNTDRMRFYGLHKFAAHGASSNVNNLTTSNSHPSAWHDPLAYDAGDGGKAFKVWQCVGGTC